MPTGQLEISYNGDSRSTPSLRNITITVTLVHGTYIVKPTNYTLVVFYGRPPSYGNDYPVTRYYLYTDHLQFEGDLNSVYSVAEVESSDNTVGGNLTASQPLPYSVTIGLPGQPGQVELKPGSTSVSFKFPLLGNAAMVGNEAVAARLEAIRKGE